MKKLRKMMTAGWAAFLTLSVFLALAPAAHADYEIDTSKVVANVPTDGTVVKWTSDVTIQWEKPDMTTGSDVLNGFVYKWNTSAAALDDNDLNAGNADGTVAADIEPPALTKPAADFATDDSNLIRYLHIKTWYLDSAASQPAYSTDVVIGPINIDNVAPAGTIRITDDSGNDIEATSDAHLNLTLAAAVDPVKVYISETSTRPATGVTYASETTYDLTDTSEGEKTIYVWFEDGAGNISPAATTDTVTFHSTVSISPYEKTIDLSQGTQVFIVDGTSDPYDWQIIDQAPSGVTVAQFTGTSNNTNSVSVQVVNEGTFKMQAAPTAGGTTLTSGTITVIKTYTLGDVNDDGSIDSGDAILVLRYSVGLTTLTDIQKAAGNVTGKADNANIDSGDAIKILRYSVGLINNFN